MRLSRTLGRWLIAGLLSGVSALGAWVMLRPAPLNVLIVTLDTTRADRVGAYVGSQGVTPVLDRLAAQAVVFERAYTPVPLTLPSHVSLMTGLNPPEHGIRLNGSVSRLADDVPLLAEILHDKGYATGAFIASFVLDGKFGLNRGFDLYSDEIRHPHGATALDSHSHPSRRGEEVVSTSLAWLHEHHKQPFFCWVHLFDPHTPYDSREPIFGDRFRDTPYDAGVAYADIQVGRLMEFLDQQGLDDETIVIVVGDHGESLGEHQERTHGLTLYESTMRVPLIYRHPQHVDRPGRISTPVSLIDIFPTVLADLGVETNVSPGGRSLVPAMRGDDLFPAIPLYLETDHPYAEGGWSPQRALISENWKYIHSPKPELYNVIEDPDELANLADTQPERLAEFERVLREREEGFTYREAETLIPTSEDQRKLASLGYAGGQGDFVEGSKDKPLADIKDMITCYNDFSDATILFVNRRFEESRDLLQDVVAAAPDYSQAWMYLGTSYLELGNIDDARPALERAVELDGDVTSRIVLGRFYLDQGEADKAQSQLETAVSMAPMSTTAHFFLGEAYRAQGASKQARLHYDRTLELSPGFPMAIEALKSLP